MVKTIVNGDYLDANDINSILQAGEQNGVIEGFLVTVGSAMDVIVSPGKAYVNGKYVVVDESQLVTIAAAHPTLGRIDVITIDENGVAAVITGSPLSIPIPPPFPPEKIVIANISVGAGVTAITNISDERIIVKHQLYKMPWLSEVETAGDVYLFDDTGRIVDPDHIVVGEVVMQNGFLRLRTRIKESSDIGFINVWIAEDKDFDEDGVLNYIGQGYAAPVIYINYVLWDVTSIAPTVSFVRITPDKCTIKLRYSGSGRVIDWYLTMRKGHRFIETSAELVQLASGDTQLTDYYVLLRNLDTRFLYRDTSVGDKFKDAVLEAMDSTGSGDNLNKNYQIVFGTSPFIWGLAYDKKASHSTEGDKAIYGNGKYTGILGRETGMTIASGDIGVHTRIFGLPFKDMDDLFKEGEAPVGEFGRSSLQGTWVVASSNNCSGNSYITNDDIVGGSSAQNDKLRYDFYVPQTGYYDLYLRVGMNRSSAIVDVKLDNVSKGTVDLYKAPPGTTWVYKKVVGSLNITQGRHNIDFLLSSKNQSSIDYELMLDYVILIPNYQKTALGGDFPSDVARQCISDNDFSFGYDSPLTYAGVYGTNRVTNDWNVAPADMLVLPTRVLSSSETIDYHRYAKKRYVSSVGTWNATYRYTGVSGTWVVETGCSDTTGYALSSTNGEVCWSYNFPRKGWYLFEARVKESRDGTNDQYKYFVRNRTLADSYEQLALDHYQDMDSGTNSVKWSKGYATIYAEQGEQVLQMKVEQTSDAKLIDFLKIYPVDPLPVIDAPVDPDEIVFKTRNIQDIPHNRLDGINQMDSIQAKYGTFNYIDMRGDIDVNLCQVKKFVCEVLGTAPTNPVEGQIYFDNVNKKFKGYNGTAWTVLG